MLALLQKLVDHPVLLEISGEETIVGTRTHHRMEGDE